jgi:hypothetical protein
MKIQPADDGALLLEEIPPFLFHLLGNIPVRASSADSRVEARFFPDPAREESLIEDWKSLVQPELQVLFQSARETVQADLRGASEEDAIYSMRIPHKHMDAWLNALNQARLAIAEESGFGEEDMASEVEPDPGDGRSMSLFEISFLGFLQECLVRMQE